MPKSNVKLIDPRENGPRLDLKPPVFDDDAVARADLALSELSGSFQEWLDKEVARLQAARVASIEAGWTNEALEAMMFAAHDLKGLGATYGYPLVTQMAASLCRLIDTDEGKAAARARPALVTAHVDAIRAAVRGGVKTDTHALAQTLLRALEAHVEALGVAPR